LTHTFSASIILRLRTVAYCTNQETTQTYHLSESLPSICIVLIGLTLLYFRTLQIINNVIYKYRISTERRYLHTCLCWLV